MESFSKTVLITGAGGFIGSNIIKKFYNGNYKIIAIIHKRIPIQILKLKNIKFINTDISNSKEFYNSIKDFAPEIIIHAAAIAKDIGNDKIFYRCNYEPIKTIAKIKFKKLIYISSTDVYGLKDFYKADENTPIITNSNNPYQKYKIKTENWIKNNLPLSKYVIVRPAAVWGKNDKTLEIRVVKFLANSNFIVHFGKWKGTNRWPMTNVNNVSDIIFKLAQTDKYNGKAINIIDSEYVTINDYYNKIAKNFFPDKKFKTIYLPIWIGKILGFISSNISNILKLKSPIFEPTQYSLKHISSNLDFISTQIENN